MSSEPPYPTVDLKPYDFVDFGCSAGGSLSWAKERFGARRGLGIDIAPHKVEAARAAGCDAMLADASRLDQFEGKVRFSTMIHFLEHLPGIEPARACIATALSISRDFVYIHQPWFDSDGALMRQGLKLYWSHWRDHHFAMTSLQAFAVLDELQRRRKVARFAIFGRTAITSSDDKAVLPLSAPPNSHAYEPSFGPKPSVALEGVYEELCVIAAARHAEKVDEAAQDKRLTKLFDSAA